MKETKMYISNLPKSCSECPCTHEDFAECNWCQAFDNGLLTFIPDEIYSKERLENCPLQTIKQHDQELVKEVCEKIGKWGNKHFNYVGDGTGYDGQDYNEMIGFNNAIIQLNEFLAQIQKEFEDE